MRFRLNYRERIITSIIGLGELDDLTTDLV